MSKHSIQRIRRLGGRLSLDFVNTVGHRPPEPRDEYLLDLGDFFAWAALTGMLTQDTARKLHAQVGSQAEALLADIVAVREGLYRVFRTLTKHRPPAADDRALFETWIRAARSRQRLQFADSHAQWLPGLPDQPDITLIDPILTDADALITGEQLERVKQCDPEEGCGWLFFDTTKNRSRRWCSMETCGSSAKARAWYYRKKRRQK